jgi:hypothetical protein
MSSQSSSPRQGLAWPGPFLLERAKVTKAAPQALQEGEQQTWPSWETGTIVSNRFK